MLLQNGKEAKIVMSRPDTDFVLSVHRAVGINPLM